jgi:hypothetical protein
MEFNISSSYGFAASSMNTSTGFCSSYIKDGEGLLVRCDKIARHKTFEFKSVYYTLYNLSIIQELLEDDIRSVFSNFHQLGFLKIGGYPADLAVVTNEGKIKLYNFDGQASFLKVMLFKHKNTLS